MTEFLGGLEWAGSIFKVLCVVLLVIHTSRRRVLTYPMQRFGAFYIMIVLVVWIAEGYFTGLIAISGPLAMANLLLYTITSRIVLYSMILIWCLVYIWLWPLQNPEYGDLRQLDT